MNINDAIKKLSYKKAQFVRYHFNLWFDQNKTMTEDEFLKSVQLKSMSTFNRFQKSDEFKHITSLVLASKTAEDLIEVYEIVRKKALDGDDKAISTLMKLHKEINSYKKEAEKAFSKLNTDEDEYDDLEL